MIVLDASVVVEMVLRTEVGEQAARLAGTERGAHAPHLLDAEVGSVLRRLERDRQISPDAALTAMTALQLLPIQRYALAPLLPRAWDLRKNLTIYDALYIALAEALGARVLTTGQRLARAPRAKAEIQRIS
jgi:predicted nucleic acid-binding protein